MSLNRWFECKLGHQMDIANVILLVPVGVGGQVKCHRYVPKDRLPTKYTTSTSGICDDDSDGPKYYPHQKKASKRNI